MTENSEMKKRCLEAYEMRKSGNYKLKEIAERFGVSSTRAANMAMEGRRIKKYYGYWHVDKVSWNGVCAVRAMGCGTNKALTKKETEEIKKRLVNIIDGKEKIEGVGKKTIAELCAFFGVEHVNSGSKKHEQRMIKYLEKKGYEVKKTK